MWEHFAHGADIGVRGRGDTRDDAFAGAALASTAVVTDPERVAARLAVAIRCTAPDEEILLVAWLNAVIYEMATRHLERAWIRSPSLRGVAEEAPGAYKDLDAVVDAAEAAGLARRVARFEPFIVVKG